LVPKKSIEFKLPISILYLLHKFSFGGTERVVVNLLNNSSSSTNNFICSFYNYENDFLNELKHQQQNVFSLNKKEGNDLSIPFKIASFCKKQNIDIIHSLGWATYAEGLVAAKLYKKKIKFIYSYRGKTIEDTIRIPKRRILAQRFFSHFCDAILTNSEISRKEYAQEIGIHPEKIEVVYNGVDVDRFISNNNENIIKKRRAFGIQENDIVVGSVARFDPVKNLEGLVNAFSGLDRDKYARCKLLLVGDGPELPFVRNTAKDLGLTQKVIFTGMRRDIPECLSVMDIYVQPSKFEGVPNAALEAMAAGLPVIATNVGGVSEIVEDRMTGILVAVDDERSLTQSIEFLVQHPARRREMGSLGRKRATSLFSIDKMVSEYEKLYEQIMQLDSGTCPKG